jgi:hypothetical protein
MGARDDQFWAAFLGIGPSEWGAPGVSFRAHVGLLGYQGLWIFRRMQRVVVSAPAQWVSRIAHMLDGWGQERLMDPDSLVEAFGADATRIIGPTFQGALDPARLVAPPHPLVRPLDPHDDAAVAQFRAACGQDAWESSGLDAAPVWRHAHVEQGVITAMAGYRAWREDVGDPCILTRPDFRGGRRGMAVTAAVVAQALANGKLVLFQTLESNQAAVRIALSLGYERYATHIAVRLRREVPDA